MKTPEQIKKAAECCVIGPCAHQPKCGECPYMYEKNCSDVFLKDVIAYIQQLETRKTVEWTPIADGLPKPGERVLICLENGLVGEGYLMHKGKWGRYDELGSVEEIFHCNVIGWMPMPESMKGEAE